MIDPRASLLLLCSLPIISALYIGLSGMMNAGSGKLLFCPESFPVTWVFANRTVWVCSLSRITAMVLSVRLSNTFNYRTLPVIRSCIQNDPQGGEEDATQAYTTCYVEGPPSEKIGRGLDALPETPACSGDPQRSEGPPSEKIGRGLDALPETPACSGDPQRSEGPPSEKIGRGLDALPQVMRPRRARTVVRVRPQKRSGADWTHCLKLLRVAETRNEVRVRRGSQHSERLNATSYQIPGQP